MKNRVTVTIQGQQYTLLALEGEEYVRRVADYVDQKLEEAAAPGDMALIDRTIFAALNIADDRFKAQEAAEHLRRQIKDLLEDASRLKRELSEAKREIFKLQQKR